MFIKIGNRLVGVIYRENPEGGGGSPTQTPARQTETFSREYVHELREENKATRLKLQEAETARKAAEDKATAADAAAQQKITEATTPATTAANNRIIKAEMKAEAVKLGLTDMDDLQLVDISAVTIKDDGTVEGLTEALNKFKEAKPHKFGQASSSHTDPPPRREDGPPKKVGEMTPEERKAAARKHGIKF